MSPVRIAFCATLMLLLAPMAAVAEVQTTPKPKEAPSIQPTPKLKSNKPLPVKCQGKMLQGKCCPVDAQTVENGKCMCEKLYWGHEFPIKKPC
jgi:hypothetical protein